MNQEQQAQLDEMKKLKLVDDKDLSTFLASFLLAVLNSDKVPALEFIAKERKLKIGDMLYDIDDLAEFINVEDIDGHFSLS